MRAGILAAFLAVIVALMGAKCPGIPDTKDVTVVIVTEEQLELEFIAEGSINVDSDVATISASDIRDDLLDLGLTQEDIEAIESITVKAVEYGVVEYREDVTDREIVDGRVVVRRLDAPADSAVLISDFDQEVYPLLGDLVPAPVEPGGIDWINDLLVDVLAAVKDETGASSFDVQGTGSGRSEPQGRETDFTWRLVISYQIPSGFPTEVVDF
jgi:hypothetical protein